MFLVISWRWVRNVVAVIERTRNAARIRTLVTSALSGLVNDAAIGTPKIFASDSEVTWAPVRTPLAVPLAALSITRKSAMKIGICRISGMQEARGFVPVS